MYIWFSLKLVVNVHLNWKTDCLVVSDHDLVLSGRQHVIRGLLDQFQSLARVDSKVHRLRRAGRHEHLLEGHQLLYRGSHNFRRRLRKHEYRIRPVDRSGVLYLELELNLILAFRIIDCDGRAGRLVGVGLVGQRLAVLIMLELDIEGSRRGNECVGELGVAQPVSEGIDGGAVVEFVGPAGVLQIFVRA